MDNAKKKMILEWLDRIDQSELSVSNFFKHHSIPFSKAQYFNYKKRVTKEGVEGLQDRRRHGGNRKLTPESEGFILGCVQSNPTVKLEWLQRSIEENFSYELSVSAISRALKRISKDLDISYKGRRWPENRPV